jgi:hypothetical protein
MSITAHLHAGKGADGVSLALVLGHQSVDVVHHIGTDGGSEHGRKGNSAANVVGSINLEDRNNRTTHLEQGLLKIVQQLACTSKSRRPAAWRSVFVLAD